MSYKEILENYRNQIDTIDYEMIYLLHRRLEIVKQVGILKKENSIDALQPKRWDELISRLKEEAMDKQVSPKLVEKIWNLIHSEALKIEK